MIGRAHHRTERHAIKPQRASMCLALIKERVTDTLPAISRQKNGFRTIKHRFKVYTAVLKCIGEIAGMADKRPAG